MGPNLQTTVLAKLLRTMIRIPSRTSNNGYAEMKAPQRTARLLAGSLRSMRSKNLALLSYLRVMV